MTHEQVREFALALGNVIRAAAVWGADKAMGQDTELTERMVHFFVAETLKAGLCRLPADSETAIVWET